MVPYRVKVYFLLSNVISNYVVIDMLFHVFHTHARAHTHTHTHTHTDTHTHRHRQKINIRRVLPQIAILMISMYG